MKKCLPVVLLLVLSCLRLASGVQAACNPPVDYTSCIERHPDYNLNVRGWESISGYLGLIPFEHDIDTGAPQLSTLVEGSIRPAVTSLRQVYDWNWTTNGRGGLITRRDDQPSDFATLVGFAANGNILVPESGYDLGGFEVLVLYATNDQILLKYTLEDSVVYGYAIHLMNLTVNPQLVAYYNQLNSQGREQLPALLAGEIIGTGGGEVWVAIRDTGSFMDPRWINDWWQTNTPGSPKPFTPKTGAVSRTVSPLLPPTCEPAEPGENMGTDCAGLPISLTEKIIYRVSDPSCIAKNFQGEIHFNNYDLPFAKTVADYFTGLYDIDHYSLAMAPATLKACSTNGACLLKNTGVSKKLLSQESQDKLKLEFLQETQNRLNNHTPTRYEEFFRLLGMSPQTVADKYRAIKIKEIQNKTLTAEEKDFLSKLWPFIPLFGNEETEGAIYGNGDGVSFSNRTSIPEVLRLHKVTDLIQKLLQSNTREQTSTQANNPIIAAPQGPQCELCPGYFFCQPFNMAIENVTYNGSQIDYGVRFTVNPGDGNQGHLSVNGNAAGTHYIAADGSTYFQSGNSAGLVNPVPATQDGTYTINATGRLDRHWPCQQRGNTPTVGISCQVVISGGVITKTTCGPAQPGPVDPCPDTVETGEDMCMKDSVPGPPQTAACPELKKDGQVAPNQFPNFFGTRRFDNDCTRQEQDCGTCWVNGACDFTNACPAGFSPVNQECNPLKSPPCDCTCVKGGGTCEKTFEVDINVQNSVPYLDSISQQTIAIGREQDKLSGLFRIFLPTLRKENQPAGQNELNDAYKEMAKPLPAEDSYVGYNLSIDQVDSDLTITPRNQSGALKFLFAKLGTVYRIKNWLAGKVLMPDKDVAYYFRQGIQPPGAGFPTLTPRPPEPTTIAWSQYESTKPLYPLDGACATSYRSLTLPFVPAPPEGKWLAVRSFVFSSPNYTNGVQIDIDIFDHHGGQGWVEAAQYAPNFLTFAYRGGDFGIDYGRGLLIYDGYADVRVVLGGAWCATYDFNNPFSANIKVEYAYLTPEEAETAHLYEWWSADRFMESGETKDIPGLFDRVKTGVISLDGLYAYSTLPTNIGFILQGNEFLRDQNFTGVHRYYEPQVNGNSTAGQFQVKNYGPAFMEGWQRIFIHAWGER